MLPEEALAAETWGGIDITIGTETIETGTWIGAVAQKDIDAATEAAAPTDPVGRVHEAAAKISLGVTSRSTAAEAEVEVRAVAAVHAIDETEAAVVALVSRSETETGTHQGRAAWTDTLAR